MKIIRLSVFSAVMALGTVPVAASTVDLTYNGFENGSVNVTITDPRRVSAAAGGFDMSGPTSSFVAWCIDVFTNMAPKGEVRSYDVSRPAQINDVDEADLNRLFTNNFNVALSSAVNSAAFQVAIWEIVYDGGGPYNLADGNFRVTSTSQAVLDTAASWLQNLGTAAGNFALTFYSSDKTQDLVTGAPSPVPLPAGLLLLGTGIGTLTVLRRRRKTA